ncbi:phosphatidylglycerol lysyltransferase domain-containing protein [Kribbella alba]|uniref:Phosphatidylglycerol lysyltransferase domain-containing protein n=1 Tax=Kribbella alba TaxID=190197 RepID=A0ABN2FGR2_9ACTN
MRTPPPDRVAPWATGLVGLLGILSILDATVPPLRPRLHAMAEILPAFVPEVAGAAAPLGATLVILSRGLVRRKRRAWAGALIACAGLAVLHFTAHEPEQAAATAVVIGLLVAARPAFAGHPDPRSWPRTASTFVLATVFATMVGIGSLLVDRHALTRSLNPLQVLNETWLGLVGISGPAAFSSARVQGRIETTLLLLGVMVAVATLTVALRPARGPHHLLPAEAEQLRELLGRYCSDSLSYFALRDDKSVVFSPSGKAAITYRVVAGVSLASGDPLGDREAWPGAIEAWLTEAKRYAWIPAVLGASEQGATVYRRHGLDALELGDEAIVDVDDFALEDRSRRSVRQAAGKALRRGYTVTVNRAAELHPVELERFAHLTAEWRDGQAERGFSMALGRFGDSRDPGTVIVACRNEEGSVVAILALVPWNTDGLSLDLMTRSPDAGNGVVELMITQLLCKAPALGVRRVSLNFAVFRAVFERGGKLGAGPVLRLWYRTLLIVSRFWQIESLYRANAKYQPSWNPRFICFPRARDLPRISTAALRAEAFLKIPGTS